MNQFILLSFLSLNETINLVTNPIFIKINKNVAKFVILTFSTFLLHSNFYNTNFATSQTPAIPKSTTENAADSPNTSVPTASEMINPARLRTAPRSLPQTLKSRPTTLKTTTKNIIANKIGIQPPPTYFLFHLTLCFTINICQSASLTDDSIAIFLPFVNLIIPPVFRIFLYDSRPRYSHTNRDTSAFLWYLSRTAYTCSRVFARVIAT